jgi:hypothetical protein
VASTITNYSSTINVDFPIAGQDNDTQGFRTNFSKIQSAFGTAATEITKLQLNVSNPGNLILNNYSKSQLYNLGTNLSDGTVVMLTGTGYNKPVYIFSNVWYTFTGTSVTLP